MKLYKFFFATLAASLFFSCSDKDEPMPADADNNNITAFSLSKDGQTYNAVITENEMTITVPYTVNLDGATADLVASPSAKVYPDPTTVRDWNNERVFRVVSYSGKSHEYTYILDHADIAQNGDVLLNNQAQVDAFGASDINVVDGNLLIGINPDEKVTDLSPLLSLKAVSGTIIIGDNYEGSDLTGLDRLEAMGGLQIGSPDKQSSSTIDVINLHKVKSISGNIEIYSDKVMMLIADKLQNLSGNLNVSSPALQTLQFDQLQTLGGDLTITGLNKAPLRNINFPALTKIGGTFSAVTCSNLTECDFAKLQSIGAVMLEKVPFNFDKLNMPEIVEIKSDFTFTSMSGYQPIGSSYTFNEKFEKFDGFTKLAKIGGTFKLEDFPKISELPNFSHATIHGLWLYRCTGLQTSIDLSATTFVANGSQPAYVYMSNVPTRTIKGHSEMDCDFLLFGDSFEFQNVNKVGSLVLRGKEMNYDFTEIYRDLNLVASRSVSFPQLTRIGGYCNIDGLTSLSFPKLTEIAGELCVPQKTSVWQFPELKSVAATPTNFNDVYYLPWIESWGNSNTTFKKGWGLYMELSDNDTFDLGKLESIGGDGWYCNLYYTRKSWSSFGLPSLKNVKGTIEIVSKPNSDTKLTELTFPSLTAADKVHIEQFKRLADFSTFAPLFKNNSIKKAEDWSIVNCMYNPTYQDMIDGKYTK